MRKKSGNEDTRYSSTQQGKSLLKRYEQRLIVAHRSSQTVTSYLRSVEFLMDFHCEDPKDLEIDQIVDFLHDLKDVKQRNWRDIDLCQSCRLGLLLGEKWTRDWVSPPGFAP